jgi:hypothetical protein
VPVIWSPSELVPSLFGWWGPRPDLIAPTLSLRTGVSEGINESRGIGAPTVLADIRPRRPLHDSVQQT